MTTTVYQDNFSLEHGHSENVRNHFHCGCAFLQLPGLVWMGRETQSQSCLRRIDKETKTQDHNPNDSRIDDYNQLFGLI